jgi:hypothetical protein
MTRTTARQSRRALVASATLAGAVALGATSAHAPVPAWAEPPEPEPVVQLLSADAGGEPVGGVAPSVSEDGRLVVFSSDPGEPAAPEPVRRTVWLRDAETGTLTEVTPPPASTRGGDSLGGVVSADGCTVTVVTQQVYDIFRDDDRGARWDVYQLTLPPCSEVAGDWELVSAEGTTGAAVALDRVDPAVTPAVSATGSVVVFGVTTDSGLTRLMVADLTVPTGSEGRLVPVAGFPADAPGGAGQYVGQVEPAVSGDGRTVAFTSDALASAVPPRWVGAAAGDTADRSVYVWDRVGEPRPAIAGAALGAEPSVSGDGSVVAFAAESPAALGSVAAAACRQQECAFPQVVMVERDLDDDGVLDEPDAIGFRLVSAVGERPGSGPSWSPSVDASGRYVAYLTRAADIVTIAAHAVADPLAGDVVVADVADRTVLRASVRPDGVTPSDIGARRPRLAGGARTVVFETVVARQLLARAEIDGPQVVGFGQAPAPVLSPLDLGTTGVGYDSFEWWTTLRNPGPTAFVPSTISTTNTTFRVSGGTCQTGVPVAPGGTCTVTVIANPSATGAVAGQLVVAEDGFGAESVAADLTAVGGIPTLASEPAGINFGTAVVGATVESRLVQVSNLGWGELSLEGAVVGGVHAGDYAVTEDTCRGTTLRAGATCMVRVGFTPTGSGVRSGIVSVRARDGDRVSTVLTGVGEFTPILFATPSVARPGQVVRLAGIGFPAGEPVVLTWSSGGRSLSVLADENGAVDTIIVVTVSDSVGPRSAVAADPARRYQPAISAPVLVVPAPRRLPPAVFGG